MIEVPTSALKEIEFVAMDSKTLKHAPQYRKAGRPVVDGDGEEN